MRNVELPILRTAMLSVVICAFASHAESLPEQVRNCFERQYAQQLQDFTIPHRVEVSNVKQDGDDGFYVADVIVRIEPTSTVYKVIIEPKGETTWTAPHIDDDIDESLLPALKREEMNAKIQRFLLTDFTVVAPVENTELNGYLKSVARFKVDFSGTDDAIVVGSGNEGKISFSGVRFFELHSTADVLAERVFIAGTKEYDRGKKQHFKKRWDIGTACASINENAGYVKALRIMETNSMAVTDETLSMYTRDMETPRLRTLRERSRSIRAAREDEAQSLRRKHNKRKVRGLDQTNTVEDADFERDVKLMIERRRKELGEIEVEISEERRMLHTAIRKKPQKYLKESKSRFDAAIGDFNMFMK